MWNIDCGDCGTTCISQNQLIKDGMYSHDDRLICTDCMNDYSVCEVCEELFPNEYFQKHECKEGTI